tara:strand:- start:810 stop:1103 length:294 start_codon:yes stop_codon:yes gene_type:complete
MCLGGGRGGGGSSSPAPPPPIQPAPVVKAMQPPPSIPGISRVDDEGTDEHRIQTSKKKKALEIKKTKEGVKQLGAIDPKLLSATLPATSESGINPPT